MPRESEAYRDTLADIIEFFDGKRMLGPTDVSKYLKKDRHTVASRFPFKNGYISAIVLARELS